MSGYNFENPLFDPEEPGGGDDYSFDLPDPPMEPPLAVQQELNASGDNLQNLQGELRQAELEAQKKRLVDSFYNEVSHTYGLRPEGRVDYSQFGIDADGKTLYWTPGDKKISVAATRGRFRFLALSTLATRYGKDGAYALRRSLGLTGYTAGTARTSRLSSSAAKALRHAEETLPSGANLEDMEMKDLSGVADTTSQSVEEVDTVLSTIDDPPMDTAWVAQVRRELAGLNKAMTRERDKLANNLAKLSDVDDRKSQVEKHLARERRKLTETDDPEIQQEIRDRIRKLESSLSDIELERQARLEALSANRAALRSQINRIRETFRRLLHEDTTLAERIRTLFREQGITIASILTAIGMAISTLVLALTGGGAGGAPSPAPKPKPSDKGGLKEWVKKHLQALGRALANLAGKAAAALPGIIGSIVSWLLNTLGKTATWLAENLWAVGIAVGTLLLVAARDWLSRRQPKRR
ncbi:MAG: hypothetical protein ABW141_20910 [Candidatus Thiodiazotropha endolucinida]